MDQSEIFKLAVMAASRSVLPGDLKGERSEEVFAKSVLSTYMALVRAWDEVRQRGAHPEL